MCIHQMYERSRSLDGHDHFMLLELMRVENMPGLDVEGHMNSTMCQLSNGLPQIRTRADMLGSIPQLWASRLHQQRQNL